MVRDWIQRFVASWEGIMQSDDGFACFAGFVATLFFIVVAIFGLMLLVAYVVAYMWWLLPLVLFGIVAYGGYEILKGMK